jgi:hypothetical protein
MRQSTLNESTNPVAAFAFSRDFSASATEDDLSGCDSLEDELRNQVEAPSEPI